MSPVRTRPEPLTSAVVRKLIAALDAELSGLYPEAGANHFRLDAEEVAPGRGGFLVAYDGDQPVGCGAFRGLDADSAEIKRMYVTPGRRGRGVGGILIEALETAARAQGIRRLVLETGLRQPEAVALYRRVGFLNIPPFGDYVGSSHSLCMGKELVAAPVLPRISLLNVTPALAGALEDAATFERTIGVTLGEVTALVKEVVPQGEEYRTRTAAPPRWGGYLAADEQNQVIGTCAFKGEPDAEGMVEIAYFTFPPFEGRGFATAMATALIDVAARTGEVRRLRAHTMPENNASSRLLRRLRFGYEGTFEDPEDGPVWRWERD